MHVHMAPKPRPRFQHDGDLLLEALTKHIRAPNSIEYVEKLNGKVDPCALKVLKGVSGGY